MDNSAEASLMGGVAEYTTPAEVLAESASDAPELGTPALTVIATIFTAC